MKILLYTIGCANCNILKAKLRRKGIEFEEITDKEYMLKLGLDSMPVLEVEGRKMEYVEAIRWVDSQKGRL